MQNYTGIEALGLFTVITEPGLDYYLKLVDASSGVVRLTYFVHSGVPLEVRVPLARYRLRYATREICRGEQALFGPGELTRRAEA